MQISRQQRELDTFKILIKPDEYYNSTRTEYKIKFREF